MMIAILSHDSKNYKPISSVIHIAWFSTALCSVFSIFAFYQLYNGLNQYATEPSFQFVNIVIGVLVGMLAGYGIVFFAGIFPKKHQGCLLYNVGFAAGIVATFYVHICEIFSIKKSKA